MELYMVALSPSQWEAPVQKSYFYTFASLYRPWSLDRLIFSMRSRICVIDCMDQLPWIWELAVYITKKRLFQCHAFSSEGTLSEQATRGPYTLIPRLREVNKDVCSLNHKALVRPIEPTRRFPVMEVNKDVCSLYHKAFVRPIEPNRCLPVIFTRSRARDGD